MQSFTVTAQPGTDAWRKPPSTDRFNAPITPLLEKPVPLKSFQSVRATLTAEYTTRYDQGGLILYLTQSADGTYSGPSPPRWLKSGVEFYEGQPYLATVVSFPLSDWSLCPSSAAKKDGVSIELVRKGDELGSGLWIYELEIDDKGQVTRRIPLREVTCFFAEEEGWYVSIGAMAARPAEKDQITSGPKELEVHFKEVHVDVS